MGRDALIVDVRATAAGTPRADRGEARPPDPRLGLHPVPAPVQLPAGGRRGPIVALADEFAGSDGDIVTAAIKSLGLGPVIGARTWGGVVGIDGSATASSTARGSPSRATPLVQRVRLSVENYGVDPDTEVFITPDDWAAGRDPQLEVAVDRALALLEENPRSRCFPSTGPVKRRPPLPPRP